jgi:hypothetical protein
LSPGCAVLLPVALACSARPVVPQVVLARLGLCPVRAAFTASLALSHQVAGIIATVLRQRQACCCRVEPAVPAGCGCLLAMVMVPI